MVKKTNGSIQLKEGVMDYVSFGSGEENLILIPGLGDSLKTVKGMAVVLGHMYREFGREYKVYIFSRKNELVENYTTRDMAKDQVEAMIQLGIEKSHIIGISQGGMIAQYIAIDFPELVDKLVLTVTLSRQNELVKDVLSNWIEMAREANYKDLIIDTAEKSYSEVYLKKYRKFYPIMSRIGRPKNFKRFLIQANSCLEHNSYDELHKIQKDTLIIGGEVDKVVGINASYEIHEKIEKSKLFIYKGLGHAAYEEAKDFQSRIIRFLKDINY